MTENKILINQNNRNNNYDDNNDDDIVDDDEMDNDNNNKPSTPIMSYNKAAGLELAAPLVIATSTPNPFTDINTIRYRLDVTSQVNIFVMDATGQVVKVIANKKLSPGNYTETWNAKELPKGVYFVQIAKDGAAKQMIRLVKG